MTIRKAHTLWGLIFLELEHFKSTKKPPTMAWGTLSIGAMLWLASITAVVVPTVANTPAAFVYNGCSLKFLRHPFLMTSRTWKIH